MDRIYCLLCGSPMKKLLVNRNRIASKSEYFKCLDKKKKGCKAIIAYTEREVFLITRYTEKDFPEEEQQKKLKSKKKKPPD